MAGRREESWQELYQEEALQVNAKELGEQAEKDYSVLWANVERMEKEAKLSNVTIYVLQTIITRAFDLGKAVGKAEAED